MKLAIMQPYIFPYIGYFQLINSVDKFVVYDDVAYIKQGWINRNRILLNNEPHMFTVPLKNASSFTLIRETEINNNLFWQWKDKFLKTLIQAYRKAPYFETTYELIAGVFNHHYESISELASRSLTDTSRYMGIQTEFLFTSVSYSNSDLKAKDRVIDICKRESAAIYINPIGGRELYNKLDFEKEGLALQFVQTKSISYRQLNDKFVPWLSIIDLLMYNSKEQLQVFLKEYELV